MTNTPLLIHGSCVARDIIRLHNDRFTSAEYIARQSLLSAFSEPVVPPREWGISSKFQIKNLNGDFLSNAPERIKKGSQKAEIMIIDLASEKHGVFKLGENRVVSATPTLRKTAYYKKIRHNSKIELGSEEHLELFVQAINNLKKLLVDLGMFGKTAVLDAPFTDIVVDGEDITARVSARHWNHLFIPYYAELRSSGFHVFSRLPEELAKSTVEHTWGRAQDHYIDAAYTWWAKQVMKFKND